jgi:anaerobic ribonucleoside-triphosphate reductase activating protein
MTERLRLHRRLERARANGPGLRAALSGQRCSLGCPGCFNPETHAFHMGELLAVDELARRIVSIPDIEGVSILGGEPLQQRKGVLALLRSLRPASGLSVLLFTGFTPAEVRRMPEGEEILGLVDVLIAGRYDDAKRLARELRGSTNKTVTFLTDRYSERDLEAVPHCEVTIEAGGMVTINGMDPLRW